MDKAAILANAQASIAKLELDFNTIFANTLTSYSPDAVGRAHGLTGSDVERILAFDQLGLVDPIEYSKPWEEVVERAREQQRKHNTM